MTPTLDRIDIFQKVFYTFQEKFGQPSSPRVANERERLNIIRGIVSGYKSVGELSDLDIEILTHMIADSDQIPDDLTDDQIVEAVSATLTQALQPLGPKAKGLFQFNILGNPDAPSPIIFPAPDSAIFAPDVVILVKEYLKGREISDEDLSALHNRITLKVAQDSGLAIVPLKPPEL